MSVYVCTYVHIFQDHICVAVWGVLAQFLDQALSWLLTFLQPQVLPLPERDSPMASWEVTVAVPLDTSEIWAYYPRLRRP